MKNIAMLSLSAMIVLTSCAIDQDLHRQSVAENDKTTQFIFGLLRQCKAKKWGRYFPGGHVCDPYFKEAVLDPKICCSEGNYSAEIMHDEKGKPFDIDVMRSNISLDKDRAITHFVTYIWAKGKGSIERTDKKIGIDRSKKDNFASVSDQYTSCSAETYTDDDTGTITRCYICRTNMAYEEFLKRMNSNNNK